MISPRAKDLVMALHDVQDVRLRWELVQQALDDEREDYAATALGWKAPAPESEP